MKLEMVLAYEFVEFIPTNSRNGALYLDNVLHRRAQCCCGCGRES